MTGKLYGTLGPACADTDTLRALLRCLLYTYPSPRDRG